MFERLVFREDGHLSAPMSLYWRFTVCHSDLYSPLMKLGCILDCRTIILRFEFEWSTTNTRQTFWLQSSHVFCLFFLLRTVVFASLVTNTGLIRNDCPVWSWYFWLTHISYNNKWAILTISHSPGWRLVVLDLPPSITIRPWLLINPGTSVTC